MKKTPDYIKGNVLKDTSSKKCIFFGAFYFGNKVNSKNNPHKTFLINFLVHKKRLQTIFINHN